MSGGGGGAGGERRPAEGRERVDEPGGASAQDPQDRPAFRGTPGAPGEVGTPPEWPQDPGAYIGHEPERATESIPGGVTPGDERIAAHSTQGTGAGRPDERGQTPDEPSGHRQGDRVSDDDVRSGGGTA